MFALLFFICFTNAWRPNPSFALTNFNNSIMTWCASIDSMNTPPFRPAGICQFRSNINGYKTNTIQSDGFAFKIDDVVYGDPFLFEGGNTIDYPGEYTHRLETYNRKEIEGVKMTKKYMFVPHKSYILSQYEITNTQDKEITVEVFDFINSTELKSDIHGKAITNSSMIFDYSSDEEFNKTVLFAGMIDADTITIGDTKENTPIKEFVENTQLSYEIYKHSKSMMMGFQKTLKIAAKETKTVMTYRALIENKDVDGIAYLLDKEIREKKYEEWKNVVTEIMNEKTKNYRRPTFNSTDEERMWNSSVLTVIHSQNPTIGTLVASFHPLYMYKVWTRDSAFCSIILAAIGDYEAAAKYLRWASQCTLKETGYYATCYSWFTGEYVGFVEPQYDAVGATLTSYYYLAQMTNNTDILMEESVKKRIRELEDFLLYRDWKNLIRPDYSIWEESSDGWTTFNLPVQYYAFSQIHGHHGLKCAMYIEQKYYKDMKRYNKLLKRADDLSKSFEKLFWNEEHQHFVQAIWYDTKEQKVIVDSVTCSMAFSGIVKDKEKMKKHFDAIRKYNTRLDYGLSRYVQDPFFFLSQFNSAGQETGEASPPWGVPTMFMSWAELLTDDFDHNAYVVPNRLKWMMIHTGPDFIPSGEAIDGISGDPVMSSMPNIYEHAGVYIMTLLQYQKQVPLFSCDEW